MKLQGKVAIVTGSGHGIGRATAITLAKEGADVVVNGVHAGTAEAVAAEIKAMGRRALAVTADVVKSKEANDMVKKAFAQFGKVDILVNNVGGGANRVGGKPAEFKDSTEEIWDTVIALSLKPMVNCTHAVINHMVERKYGKIVNIASFVGTIGGPGMVDYSTAKAGIIGFTKSLAKEVGRFNINVNCVSPGVIETEAGHVGKLAADKQMVEIMGGSITMGALRRFGTPQEIANVVLLLVSDDGSFVTGANYAVDAGASIGAGASIAGEWFMWGKH